jgi:fibronectin type 3 domain-containing protein
MVMSMKQRMCLAVLAVALFLAQDTKPHKATLTWVQGAPQSAGDCAVSSNNIYRSTVANQETLFASIPAATTYVDTTVLAGKTYFYKVSALSCAGESPLSMEVSATIPHKPGGP